MKTKKIDREFLLSDSSVNVYGFRLLTSGYLIDEYKKNPIGYHMHDRKGGVVLKWDDIRIEGDKVVGKPVINLSNARGQQTVDEVENGFLNAASVGHFVVLETSDDPKLMLPGQTGPTVTKWYNRECSLCDVPGNMNALALYDGEGNEINLTDFNKKINMKQIFLTAEQLTKLGLKAESDTAIVDTTINDLVAKAAKVDQLTADLTTATTEKTTAVNALTDYKKGVEEKDVTDQLAAAVTETKITAELSAVLAIQYKGRPADLKTVLAAMKPYESVTSKIGDKADPVAAAEIAQLMAKSGNELYNENKLDRLKELNLAAFKVKYKECFDEDYKEEVKK